MRLPQLARDSLEFPPTSEALTDPNGLLAFGGDLSVKRLLAAYRLGIFPWFNPGQPILWWSPDPRTIFFPEEIHCSRSMQKFLRQTNWQVSIDVCFSRVIDACAETRANSSGTWITAQMKSAYNRLHEAGYAHSVEVWDGSELVGGIYGVALGKTFFGESMFSTATNASKTALIRFCRFLHNHDFAVFDAQVASDHLFTMGALTIPRLNFEEYLADNGREENVQQMQTTWQAARKKLISDDGYLIN